MRNVGNSRQVLCQNNKFFLRRHGTAEYKLNYTVRIARPFQLPMESLPQPLRDLTHIPETGKIMLWLCNQPAHEQRKYPAYSGQGQP